MLVGTLVRFRFIRRGNRPRGEKIELCGTMFELPSSGCTASCDKFAGGKSRELFAKSR
jgi:hypothetical protein